MSVRCFSATYVLFALLVLAGGLYSRPLKGQQDVFDRDRLHEVHIYVSEEDWFEKLEEYYNAALEGADKRFLKALVRIDGEQVSDAGVRFKGNYSNQGFPGKKKPFRLDFNTFRKGQSFQGLTKLNLHNLAGDPSFLREYIAYGLFGHLGIPAPRLSFTRLYINDRYWGCYLLVEEPDKVFAENRFGKPAGNLFEAISGTGLDWWGNDPGEYPELELKTKATEGAWDKLLQWMELFNTYQGYDFYRQLSGIFNTEAYLKVLAVDVLLNNWDSYYGTGRNFFIYDDPLSGKLHWIPWDYNLAFQATAPALFPRSAVRYHPLIWRIMRDPQLREQYLHTWCGLLDRELITFNIDQRIHDAVGLITRAVEEDTLKFYATESFYLNAYTDVTEIMQRNKVDTEVPVPGVGTLFKSRMYAVRHQLQQEGCDCSRVNDEMQELPVRFFPNPAREYGWLYTEEKTDEAGPYSIQLYDVSGLLRKESSLSPVSGSMPLDLSDVRPGFYVLKITAGTRTKTIKLITE